MCTAQSRTTAEYSGMLPFVASARQSEAALVVSPSTSTKYRASKAIIIVVCLQTSNVVRVINLVFDITTAVKRTYIVAFPSEQIALFTPVFE